MIIIPGYRITAQIYSGVKTQVWRGISESDEKPVAIKMLKSEYPSINETILFRNQYTIAKNLNLPGIVKHYQLEKYRHTFALIMEDFGGISLAEYMNDQRDGCQNIVGNINDFFPIAIQIAEILEGLHQNRIIHKDIKPQNILINPETKQVKLIDFSISSLLPRENQEIQNLNRLEGTIAYISPEQTGRMNRGIDYRTDFYSLGITFYELLTGQKPFQSNDIMELIHCHIARQPIAPLKINPKIPEILSDIILKLIEKNAENRYQTAFGIKSDLKKCLEQYQNNIQILPFELGSRDISQEFRISEKLYGRESEVQALLTAFNRVSQGTTEVILIAGFSGIGKTAVVNEVHKPIVRQRGYFIKGKYDQFNRDIPFSAWVQAFQSLMRQLLTESKISVQIWQDKILEALGENGQVIIDVIPELERIIGKQEPAPELEGNAAQNRFNLLFGKFIRVFATKEHPLVIFLDDLQWADGASLQLIKLLLGDINTQYLLLIGAYRDNEVSPIHPLMLTMDEIFRGNSERQYANININKITLEPLQEDSLNRLISDTLSCPNAEALALTELVFVKTKGNPFFSNQFLKSLQVEGLIFFDFGSNYWQYNLAKIRSFSVSDDVVEFMASQLQRLPENTQNVLKLAACIGHSFDLSTLSIAYEKSLTETATDLWKALQEGLVIPTNEIYKLFQDSDSEQVVKNLEVSIPYKFLHDRVQQAANLLIPEDEKAETHLKIGRLLLRKCGQGGNPPTAAELEEKIFDIVNQLSYGVELITTQSERDELANLHLIAGRKAKNSTAYAAAFDYLNAGIKLLDNFSWKTHYQMTLGLYEQAVEAAFLCGKFEEIEQLSEVVLQQAKTSLDKIKVYEIKIFVADVKGNLRETVNIGLEALALLGISLPNSPNNEDIEQELQEKKAYLSESNIGDFINLPIMIDPEKLAAISIINHIIPVAYTSNRPLFLLLACQEFELSLKYGNTVLSACAYADFGKIVIGLFQDVESAFDLGKLALELLGLLNAKKFKSRALLKIAVFNQHWKYPVRESLSLLQEGYKNSLETGDIDHTGYLIFFKLMYSYFSGLELKELDAEIANYSPILFKFKQKRALSYYQIFQQVIYNLLGKVENPCILSSANYNEEEALIVFKKVNDKLGICHFYLNKSILCYLFNNFQEAAQNINIAMEYIEGATAMFSIPVCYFYASLIELSLFDNANSAEQQLIIQKVENNQKQMQYWATYAPKNHQHKFDLVEAEKHRVLGQNLEAIEAYERAIAEAKASEFLQEEALAYELAAKFYLEWSKNKIANVYFNDAYAAYTRWGATAKTNDLEERYPDLFEVVIVNQFAKQQNETTASITQRTLISSNNSSSSGFLDLTAVIKASHALSLEINLAQLLSTFMRLLMENAGASKGALILEESGEFIIEATGISENSEIVVLQSIPLETSYDLPITVINYVARTQLSTILNDVQSEISNPQIQIPTLNDSYLLQYQPKSVLCTPIINQGKLFGILYLENNLATGAFTPERLEVLNILSSQAAISIENARLYKSLEDKVNIRTAQLAQANQEIMALNSRLKADNLRMSAELEVTKKLQQMILPMQSELEAVEGLEIAAFMKPADEVGGDYYDILKHNGKVKISIGDVTGHGLESGVLMIMAQTAIRTLLEVNETNPVTFLNVLNRTLYHNLQRMQSNKNMTLSLLDYKDGLIALSGQHEYLIVVRANGEIELIDTIELGFPLGLEENIADCIDQIEIQLNSEDVAVLYTDGITEAEDINHKYYGLERLAQVVQECRQQSSPQIRQAVIDDVRRHIGKQKVFDDITLLVLKQK